MGNFQFCGSPIQFLGERHGEERSSGGRCGYGLLSQDNRP